MVAALITRGKKNIYVYIYIHIYKIDVDMSQLNVTAVYKVCVFV